MTPVREARLVRLAYIQASPQETPAAATLPRSNYSAGPAGRVWRGWSRSGRSCRRRSLAVAPGGSGVSLISFRRVLFEDCTITVRWESELGTFWGFSALVESASYRHRKAREGSTPAASTTDILY
jgi:hypothetical protein